MRKNDLKHIVVNKEIHDKAKIKAINENTTLGKFAEDALIAKIGKQPAEVKR